MAKVADQIRSEPSSTFWVSLRYFSLTRLVIAAVLLGAVLMFGNDTDFGSSDISLFVRTAIAYAVLGTVLGYLALARPQRFYLQLGAQLLLDVFALTLLLHASEGTRSGIALLYLLPIAGTAILSPPLFAVFFAAVCALAVLIETVLRGLSSEVSSPLLVQAGVYGIAYFAIAIVMNRLAAGLIAQEQISSRRFRDLQSQIEINRLVVADMQDGVLILSGDGYPRALNPAAMRMLHLRDANAIHDEAWEINPVAGILLERFNTWRRIGADADSFEMMIGNEERADGFYGNDRVRARFVAASDDINETEQSRDFVVFLEDLQRVDERAQDLKLASMGRLVASIAHEIRNPLAAISHANALLREDLAGTPQARLLDIVQENTRRLDRIVQNILQLARKGSGEPQLVHIKELLVDVTSELEREKQVEPGVLDVSLYGDPILQFNPDHLRQVLVNLLQNALRYASGKPGSISVVVVPILPQIITGADGQGLAKSSTERIEVIVQDDGEAIDDDTRRHLFEPFFTTHHRGTGLGLYLARELCLANGATLGFVPNANEKKKGGFVVNAAGGTV
jgi:two-component system sensor histidine kinase PilS (NtrC family)